MYIVIRYPESMRIESSETVKNAHRHVMVADTER